MVKMTYQKPEAELIRFDNEDVITTSGDCGVNSAADDAFNPDKCGMASNIRPGFTCGSEWF